MARGLSYAGRLQLIRAVLFGVQAYWAQLFLLPQKVIKLIEAACRSYLWSGEAVITKRALIAWDNVCLPKEAGELNVIKLKVWNQTAICKLLWALSQNKEKLWITWIHTYYIKKLKIEDMEIPSQPSWMVRKILNMRKYWFTGNMTNQVIQQDKFHISTAYKNLVGDVPNVVWKNLVCNNLAEQKQVFILWLALHEKLRTKNRLIKWGMKVDENKFWVKFLSWLKWKRDAKPWKEECNWIIQQTRGRGAKGMILKAGLAAVIHTLWIERNSRVFQNKA
ncbi:uncharacterized protein LOC132054196 [Lycium ferocissimum]|uniref:uncharacterized protein LOC132054196 n=1 Tax=Lycium ferocissimum TaxID=112874 RepID=UPI00281528DA|nr:uncharacterized protein LOC132054196 [Lycium ferocissimum]